MSFKDDLRTQWRTGGTLVRLILVNLGVFTAMVLAYLLLLPAGGGGQGAQLLREAYVTQWLRSSADPEHLLYRPWTAFTYMFLHTGVGHIFWNMVLLWLSGRLFQDLLGGKRLLGNYVLGGLSGLLLFVVTNNLTTPEGHALPSVMGASAGVMAVLVGIAAYRPTMVVHLLLIGPVKLMYVAAVVVLLDLLGIGSGDGVAHEAHIGGALYGILAASQLRKGRDWSLAFAEGLERLGGLFRRRSGPRLRVEKRHTRSVVERDAAFNATKREQQAKVDAILDKISRSGYDSLSKAEKDFLFRAGGGDTK